MRDISLRIYRMIATVCPEEGRRSVPSKGGPRRRWKMHFTWWAMGLVGCATTMLDAATINVLAAASLTDSLKEIAAAYEKQTGDKIVLNFGASSFLARQIQEGAPAEGFRSEEHTSELQSQSNLVCRL